MVNKTLRFYKYENDHLFSYFDYENLEKVSQEEIKNSNSILYYLNKLDPLYSRKSFSLSHPSLMFLESEGINLLQSNENCFSNILPSWILEKINNREIVSINTEYPNWEKILSQPKKKKWKVNLIALGDVGSTLLIGLRLLGGDCIEEIGMFDRNINRLKRWEYELNQVRYPFNEKSFPPIKPIDEEDLFNCDMFIFCASKGIPPVGSNVVDVRMAQFESNSEIIKEYALKAREKRFNGIFAVVSDPVDLLCKVAFLESNKNSKKEYDFLGLSSNQIIGYGLGVMNGRACFYAEQSKDTIHYLEEGRVFGPHGEGLIVADSIQNYNEEISDYLTYKTLNANKEVRSFGFKPYVAPSLSSGALSIISTIKGHWFYGSTYMGRAYVGSKCRLISSGIEVEQLDIPYSLLKKITNTYESLVSIR
ncbi:lactate dehydrogenase [Tissierella sp. MSJ-40]|uniref:Lactate dehydrogenase n=1 Tax=Tissierella simiarum TaxID=2841534 RepID=A0ABS6E682_9FIRM|nr:lactate dehydrogenase [Tissierella simiarum]MBU5437935.1 lactate dehydrogenase [Tissierella simiarum]